MSPAEGVALCGWGRVAPSRARLLRPGTGEEVADALAQAARDGGAIARGAGRSYGDAAQNGGGSVIDATALRKSLQLDTDRDLLHVGAGWTFGELLLFLARHGLTLPVVPGTRHLTVGGAIAADVHGKNHLHDGSLARHVESLLLCTPADGPREVSAASGRELFEATLGGMGLTGVVVQAALRVRGLRSCEAVADVDRLGSIEQALAMMGDESRMGDESPHRYAIAWLDLLSPGRAFGRAVLTRSDEAIPDEPASDRPVSDRPVSPFAPSARVNIPRGCPNLLRPSFVCAFNNVYWRAAPRHARGRRLSMSAQLFPLDALGQWSRLYGSGGLLQYQFAIPHGREEVLLEVVQRLRRRRLPMYLAALKRLGTGTGAPLSFPIEGFTLAIDLPARAPGVHGALDEADELVAGAGGRVYLAKDARMRSATLAAMYPRLSRLRELRAQIDPEGALRSDMARRLGLCE